MEKKGRIIPTLLILGRKNSPTEEEIAAYREANPPHMLSCFIGKIVVLVFWIKASFTGAFLKKIEML